VKWEVTPLDLLHFILVLQCAAWRHMLLALIFHSYYTVHVSSDRHNRRCSVQFCTDDKPCLVL